MPIWARLELKRIIEERYRWNLSDPATHRQIQDFTVVHFTRHSENRIYCYGYMEWIFEGLAGDEVVVFRYEISLIKNKETQVTHGVHRLQKGRTRSM